MMAGHEEGSDESPVRNYEQQHFKNISLPISQFRLHGGIQLLGDNRKADPGRHALHDIWLHTAAGARKISNVWVDRYLAQTLHSSVFSVQEYKNLCHSIKEEPLCYSILPHCDPTVSSTALSLSLLQISRLLFFQTCLTHSSTAYSSF